jgi:hypothetical protein
MPYLSLSPATVPLFHIRLGVRLEGRHPALRRTGIDNDRLARNRAGVVRRLEERNVEPSSSLLEIPRKRTTSRASRVMPRRSLSRRTEIGEFLPGVVSHDGGHQIFPGVPESFGTQSVVSPFGSRTASSLYTVAYRAIRGTNRRRLETSPSGMLWRRGDHRRLQVTARFR